MEFIVRPAEERDLAGLDQVLLAISDGSADPEKSLAVLRSINRDKQKYLMVAENKETGEICGTLFGLVFEDISDDCRPILLVENVAVLESYRGMGVGKKLFEAIEDWGKSFDCRYEMLVSGLERTGAHRFYEALGFSDKKGFKKYF